VVATADGEIVAIVVEHDPLPPRRHEGVVVEQFAPITVSGKQVSVTSTFRPAFPEDEQLQGLVVHHRTLLGVTLVYSLQKGPAGSEVVGTVILSETGFFQDHLKIRIRGTR
jgi:hypothetical protein